MRVINRLTCGAAVLSLGFGLLFSSDALARPEYALRQKVNCTSCHELATGGGPRNLYGKAFGSHEHFLATTSSSDVFYGDFRSEAYYPFQRTGEQSNGLFLMVAAPSVAPVIVAREEGRSELKALLTADFGSLSNGTREAVLIWRKSNASGDLVPDQVTFGRFYLPFGLMTDEHRTYTKILTQSSIRDYEMGGLFSWYLGPSSQLNLAVTNGFHSGGSPGTEGASFAASSDLRWNPKSLPLFVGMSGSIHRSGDDPGTSPYAGSLYSGVYFGPFTVMGEAVIERYWNTLTRNPRLSFFFTGENASTLTPYLATIQGKTSGAAFGTLLYDVSSQFTLEYRYDAAAFDLDTLGDTYNRHGFGFRWFFANNLSLWTRVEFVGAQRDPARGTLVKASQEVAFVMLRLWI